MENRKSEEPEEKTEEEFQVVNLKEEYGPEYNGKEVCGIITALSSEELEERWPELCELCRPYIILPPEFGEARKKFLRNEWKFKVRNRRGHIYNLDEMTECCHPKIAIPSCEKAVVFREIIGEALEILSPVQRSRLIRSYVYGYKGREIAMQDGVAASSVSLCLMNAVKKLRQFMEESDEQ